MSVEIEIDHCTNRYQEHFQVEKSQPTTLAIDKVLALIGDFAQMHKNSLFVTEREIQCDCKNIENCVCDHDEYIHISDVTTEILSNCGFQMKFRLAPHSRIRLSASKKKTWRVFQGEEDECLFLDIIPVAKTKPGKNGCSTTTVIDDDELFPFQAVFYTNALAGITSTSDPSAFISIPKLTFCACEASIKNGEMLIQFDYMRFRID